MYAPALEGLPLKIAIYRTSSIGDVILATACIDLLRRLPCKVELTWLGRRPTSDVISGFFPNIKMIEIGTTTLADASKLAKQVGAMHLIVDLQRNLRSRFITKEIARFSKSFLVRVPKKQGLRHLFLLRARLRGRTARLPISALSCNEKQYQSAVSILKEGLSKILPPAIFDYIVNVDARPRLLDLDCDFEESPACKIISEKPWAKELSIGCWVAIAPGASYATKRAPTRLFKDILTRVANEILDRKSREAVGLVFLGDEQDREAAIEVLSGLKWMGPVLNLCGKLRLGENAIALKLCKILLSNDSSLGHIAEAVATPVAILFGPTVEGFGFAPHLPQSRAFSTPIGCRPCSKHGKTPCRFQDKLCFEGISAPLVASHILHALDRPHSHQDDLVAVKRHQDRLDVSRRPELFNQ